MMTPRWAFLGLMIFSTLFAAPVRATTGAGITYMGRLFDKHYCTIAVCCPSSVNLWTGQMAHNTNVTNVQPPWGEYSFTTFLL